MQQAKSLFDIEKPDKQFFQANVGDMTPKPLNFSFGSDKIDSDSPKGIDFAKSVFNNEFEESTNIFNFQKKLKSRPASEIPNEEFSPPNKIAKLITDASTPTPKDTPQDKKQIATPPQESTLKSTKDIVFKSPVNPSNKLKQAPKPLTPHPNKSMNVKPLAKKTQTKPTQKPVFSLTPKLHSPQQKVATPTKKAVQQKATPQQTPQPSTPGTPKKNIDFEQQLQQISQKYDHEIRSAQEMENELSRVQQTDHDLSKTLEEITESMSQYHNELQEIALKICLQNNRLMMLESPVLKEKYEELQQKLSEFVDVE